MSGSKSSFSIERIAHSNCRVLIQEANEYHNLIIEGPVSMVFDQPYIYNYPLIDTYAVTLTDCTCVLTIPYYRYMFVP